MLRAALSVFLILLACSGSAVAQGQYSGRAYAPENIGSLTVRDQIRVIDQEYREQSRGRQIPDDQLDFYLDQIKLSRWNFSRIKSDIAVSLRGNANGGGWQPPPGNGWNQQTVICSSKDRRYSECRTPFRNRARLIENISDTRCYEGQNWGSRQGLVWVDKGCRGRFIDSGNGWGGNTAIRNFRCESIKGRYNECRKPYNAPAFLVRNLSETRCTENRNWGQRGNTVWVNGGCRGEFGTRGGSGNNNGWGYNITCSSSNGRYNTCAWDRNRGTPQLLERIAGRCAYQSDWGYNSNSVWVKNGCSARFGTR